MSHQPYVQTGHHSGAVTVGLSMDNSSLVSGDTPSLNYTSSWMSSYSPSMGSDESISNSVYSSLKSIKNRSSETPSSWWSDERMSVVDEYHGVPY